MSFINGAYAMFIGESAKSIGDIFAAHTPASTKKTLKAKQGIFIKF